jgi:hypothetical protein
MIPLLAPTFTTPPPIGDGRPSLAYLHDQCDALTRFGWRKRVIATQETQEGELLPICAYCNAAEIDLVLIGGIHGREPAGAIALAWYAERLRHLGAARNILLLPLLNPWGYFHHTRYGPSGQSVSDSDHLLGRAEAPACPEAGAITHFLLDGIAMAPGTAVLDLHEDAIYEAPDYVFAGRGSYLYVSGDAALAHPTTQRVIAELAAGPFPLIRQGVTRFGEALADGLIVDTVDGSIDELLARRKGCSPVLTTELVLTGPQNPPLAERVAAYTRVIDAFFGA